MPKKSKKKNGWKELYPRKKWTDGKEVTIMDVGKVNNNEGISLKRAGLNREGKEYPKKGKFWISSKMDVESWINWLYSSIKEVFRNLWGKSISTDLDKIQERIKKLEDEKNTKENEIEDLRKELENFQILKEELKKKEELIKNLKKDPVDCQNSFDDFEKNYVQYSFNNDKRYEEKVKEFLEENKWLLGLDCEFCKKNVNLDQQTQIDLHVVNNFGQNKVFEFKSPNLKVFDRKKDDSYKRLKASAHLLEGLDEIITYIKRTKINAQLLPEGGLKIIEPTGIIVIGYNLDVVEKDFLETWNNFLYPHIRIISYNSLLNKAKQELELIKKVKKEKIKNES